MASSHFGAGFFVKTEQELTAPMRLIESDLAQQVHDWQQLHTMSSLLLQARSLEDQFAVALRTVTAFHECGRGMVSLYDPKLNGLITQASVDLPDSALATLGFVPCGTGSCGVAYQESRRVIIEDVETDPLCEAYRAFAKEQGIRALYSTPFFSMNGEPLGVLSVYFSQARTPTERELQLTDICAGQMALFVERDRTEKELRREQQRSHQILESMKAGFVLMDSEFRIVQINTEAVKMIGRPTSEILGLTHWELWPSSKNLPIGQFYKQVMQDRQQRNFENCHEFLGRKRWIAVKAYPHEDEGMAVLFHDITEQKETQAALAEVVTESERRYRLYETFLAHTPDLAYVFDLDHRFVYANEVLLQMWDKTWDEAIGKNCLELGYEPWHAQMHGREIEYVKAAKQPIRGEVPFNGTFGRRIYDYIFVPVLGPDGEVEAIAGTTRDVTDRKKHEEELHEANLRKDEFLAMLAHELRNPLAPISAAAELMEIGKLDEKQIRHTSQIISRQVRHMAGLVDDLLDASRVTRGLVRIDKSPQALQSIVSNALEQTKALIDKQGHHLTLEISPIPAYVLGDTKRLVQILTNLINNAAKYTPPGGHIRIRMEVVEDEVRLLVQDNGTGIEPALQARIFELFTQAERTADRSQGGLGIGLAVVRSLVALHGGTINCESEGVGKGCRFTVILPCLKSMDAPSSRPLEIASSDKSINKRRILVVDDSVDGAVMLSMYLEVLGHEVTIEHHPKHALERAKSERPDVCVLDIGLPEMDGYELARRLRAHPETAHALLIASTGYGHDHDRKTGLDAGFDHYLIKPVDVKQLASLITG